MPEPARMLLTIPSKHGTSSVTGCTRGKGSPMIFDKNANTGHESGNRKLLVEGRRVSTIGPSEATIARHGRGQEKADIALDKPGVGECEDPFAWRRPVRPARHVPGRNAA